VVETASAFVEFTVNYEQNKYLAGGKAVHSDAISAGGHTWRINFYPNGIREPQASSDHLCIALELLSKPGGFDDAIFEVLIDKDRHVRSRTTRMLLPIHDLWVPKYVN
jgi:speckle-type POZ protein